jgi:hypothetical protein
MSRRKLASEKPDTQLSDEKKWEEAHFGRINREALACAVTLWNAAIVETQIKSGPDLKWAKFYHDRAWALFSPKIMEAFASKNVSFFHDMADAIEFHGVHGSSADPVKSLVGAHIGFSRKYGDPMPTRAFMCRMLKSHGIAASMKTVRRAFRHFSEKGKPGRPKPKN